MRHRYQGISDWWCEIPVDGYDSLTREMIIEENTHIIPFNSKGDAQKRLDQLIKSNRYGRQFTEDCIVVSENELVVYML